MGCLGAASAIGCVVSIAHVVVILQLIGGILENLSTTSSKAHIVDILRQVKGVLENVSMMLSNAQHIVNVLWQIKDALGNLSMTLLNVMVVMSQLTRAIRDMGGIDCGCMGGGPGGGPGGGLGGPGRVRRGAPLQLLDRQLDSDSEPDSDDSESTVMCRHERWASRGSNQHFRRKLCFICGDIFL